jgi:iron complex outermembrane receptor protein
MGRCRRVATRAPRIAVLLMALPLFAAGAQDCALTPASGALEAPNAHVWSPPLDRRIALHLRGVSLREALDHSAAAASIRLSYSADLVPLDRAECAAFDNAQVGDVLTALLHDTPLMPVGAGGDLVVLTRRADGTPVPTAAPVPVLQRIVVTGSAIGAPQRSLTVALDVLSGKSLDERRASTLGDAFDSSVPGIWAWPQTPTSLLASYGSIRGASSFGVSYPKIYIDGIQVANPLLVSRFAPEAVDHVEVIRGPQGSALYGSDAISGVVNITSLHQAPDSTGDRFVIRTSAGASASDYASAALTQQQSVSVRLGSSARVANFTVSGGSIGDYIPRGHSANVLAVANGRRIGARTSLTGVARFFGENAGAPISPVLVAAHQAAAAASSSGPGSGGGDQVPLLLQQPNQSVREYTAGGTASLMASDRWTHSVTAGLDGYRLRNVATDQTPIPTEADSALRAAQGGADRITVRASSVARLGSGGSGGCGATNTIAA